MQKIRIMEFLSENKATWQFEFRLLLYVPFDHAYFEVLASLTLYYI